MIRYTILFIGLFTFQSLHSQNIELLDSKYGMNKFKLESSISMYETDLEFYDGEKPAMYEYIGNDVEKIFEYNIGKIYLGYFDEKLYHISFYFEDNYFNKENVVQKLEALFGEAYIGGIRIEEYGDSKTIYEYAYIWEGERTYLALEKMTYIVHDEETTEDPVLWLISKDLRIKMIEADF